MHVGRNVRASSRQCIHLNWVVPQTKAIPCTRIRGNYPLSYFSVRDIRKSKQDSFNKSVDSCNIPE